MHDAIRGDAIAGIMAAQNKNEEQLKEVDSDFKEHTADIVAKIDLNRSRGLGPIVAGKLDSIRVPLEKYLKISGETLALAHTDVAALPWPACIAPLPQWRRALHSLQTMRGGMPGTGHHH